MEENKQQLVSVNETTEILNQVYRFIRTVDSCKNCLLEYLSEDCPSTSLKRVGNAYKTKINIIGGYNAELPFIMYHKAKVNDTKSIIDITKPLDDLANVFNLETKSNFPNLILPEGYQPLKIEMVETPEDASGKENNEAIFMAIYKIHYKTRKK